MGAVVHDGYLFVTTPNQNVVYYPPLGSNRNVRLRNDFRFGDNDPLVWPQPYLGQFCHFGAILRKPQSDTEPLAIMWWTPDRTSFIPMTANIITGVGRLEISKLDRLRVLVDSVAQRVDTYRDDVNHPHKNQYCLHTANALKHAFARLESLPMSWRQVQFGVAHVQRFFLETTAALDYLYVFKPRMDGDLPAATHVEHRIGAFTMEPLIAQEFVRAGLPIWLVRRYGLLPSVRIDSVKEPRQPGDLVCLEDATPPFPTIFRGPATHSEKYNNILGWIRTFVKYPNPFDVFVESDGAPLVQATPSNQKGRDQGSKISRVHHPC